MKRLLLTLMLMMSICLTSSAMSYEEARRQAWFLTDKMAYELNLTPEQYDRVYQINLDYLMSIRTVSDCNGYYWRYRDQDFRYVLFDWQYELYSTLDYFFRPVRWVRAAWYYPVFEHYRRGYYYFDCPTVYVSYRGGMWNRRGHESRSPYFSYRPTPGYGMRNHYVDGPRPGYGRPTPPPVARPERPHKPDVRPERPSRPSRPDETRPNRPNRPGGRGDASRPSEGQTSRPSFGNGGNNGQGHTFSSRGHGNQSTRPSNGSNRGQGNFTPTRNRPSQMTAPSRSNSGNGGNAPSRSGRSFGR